ncbi:MAG: sulfotransferase [Cyclobacterium sp.]|uniref:sulfotransferase n=2 Tax=Cyclobacterium TaxID=68288 RepID=UPI001969E41C
MKSKIFGIGLPRTGTQSLTQAMRKLGFVSGHCLSPNQWNKIDHFDFVCDSPVPSRFIDLDRIYPGSKFILTTRNVNNWLSSCRTFFIDKRPPERIKEKWFLDYRIEIFGTAKFDAKLFEETYYKHNERVRKHFLESNSRLLILDITKGEGWVKLIDFLGLSIDSKELGPFPFEDFVKRKKSSWLNKEKKVPAIKVFYPSNSPTINLNKLEINCIPKAREESKPLKTKNLKQILSILEKLNDFISKNEPAKNEVGLLNGKIGLSIYFFMLGRSTRNSEILSIAEHILMDVYNTLGNFIIPTNFQNGLSGIAWGLCHLIKNDYVEGDPDEILIDVDHQIISYWNANKETLPVDLRLGLLGYLAYYTSRLEISQGHAKSVNQNIHTRVVSEIINRIGQLVEEEKFQHREPELFTLYWDLPLLLILLAKAKQLQVNSNKIDRILDYLTPIITSLYPRLHSNRMYLLLGLESIFKELPLTALQDHADLLKESISLDTIIDEECKNLNILAQDGITGLAWISRKLSALTGTSKLLLPMEKIIQKTSRSNYWEENGYNQDMVNNCGLTAGLGGIGILLLEYLNDTVGGKN